MAGATKTGISAVGVALAVALAVALMGAAPIPPGPQVVAGEGYDVAITADMHSKARVKIFFGTRTVPNDAHLALTLRVKVLAASGGVASRVQLTYVKVDAPGGAGAQARKLAGRTFVVTRGFTAKGDPQVTEGGKPVAAKLARKVWDDVSGLMAPPKVTALRQAALAHPGQTCPVPPAIYGALAGRLEHHGKLVSGGLTLVKVAKGKATLRLLADEQLDAGGMTVDLKTTRTQVVDAATGRTLRASNQTTVSGAGKVHTPIGTLPAKVHGTGSGSGTYTWHPAPAPGP